LKKLDRIGPGLVLAATGLGAGDLIAASVAGASFGYALLWTAVVGAVLKFALNEGLARWQLVTGSTLLEGWRRHLPAPVSWYFIAYLLVWTLVVAAALMAACGLAAHALFPDIGVGVAGAVHSLVALVLVLGGRYAWLERIMKLFIALMFVVVVYCAMKVFPGWPAIAQGLLVPGVPPGSLWLLLGVVGGVGGSVTLLSYGYWINERGWRGSGRIGTVRLDLAVAYSVTALFAVAVMLVSAGVRPEVMQGSGMVLSVADHLGKQVGETGRLLFLIGFWGAVFSSMLGVWQGVPYLFCDFVRRPRNKAGSAPVSDCARDPLYRAYLVAMSTLPMLLLGVGKPVWLVVLYAVVGALFMPLLAVLLLFMNNRRAWMQAHTNHWLSNSALLLALVLFATLLVHKFVELTG
jgi:Mn2+/Fe2+ NRAMP family transporter